MVVREMLQDQRIVAKRQSLGKNFDVIELEQKECVNWIGRPYLLVGPSLYVLLLQTRQQNQCIQIILLAEQ